jgi:mono/diheme cytochrome c family protein
MEMHRAALAIACALALPGTAVASTGGQLFAIAGCGGCHTLAAAGSSGNVGPNLDQLRPSAGAVDVQVTSGGGGMPSFGASLSATQISTLASWVSSVAGGSPSAGGAVSPLVSLAPKLPVAKVRTIQTDLARLGFFHHVVTGFYGPVTKAAVAAFQRSAGLAVDGLWGPKTAAAVKRRTG